MVREKFNQLTERRTFLKGAAATGAALVGVSGSAAAQQQNLGVDSDNIVADNDGLLSISLQNTNVLNNVNVEDVLSNITVTVQDIEVDVSDVIEVGDVTVVLVDVVDIVDVLNENNIAALNNVNVQVAILGANRRLSGSDTVQLIN